MSTRAFVSQPLDVDDPDVKTSDLLSAPTTMPTEPRQIWQELPGRILRVTDPWLLEGSVWDDDGAWYDSQVWE